MSNTTIILGTSGSGKSTSLRNLDPKTTFICNVLDKPLPFRGYKSHYKPIIGWNDVDNNYYSTDDYVRLIRCIKMVNESRSDIKVLVIDDFNYVMCNEFMRRASEKGFEKFSEMANHVWNIFQELNATRPDLLCFVLSHSDADQTGFMKIKTIGKMLDDKVTLEGMATTVLHSLVVDGQHQFLTTHDGFHLAKSPLEMFPTKYIDNDLLPVVKAMTDYYNEEI